MKQIFIFIGLSLALSACDNHHSNKKEIDYNAIKIDEIHTLSDPELESVLTRQYTSKCLSSFQGVKFYKGLTADYLCKCATNSFLEKVEITYIRKFFNDFRSLSEKDLMDRQEFHENFYRLQMDICMDEYYKNL